MSLTSKPASPRGTEVATACLPNSPTGSPIPSSTIWPSGSAVLMPSGARSTTADLRPLSPMPSPNTWSPGTSAAPLQPCCSPGRPSACCGLPPSLPDRPPDHLLTRYPPLIPVLVGAVASAVLTLSILRRPTRPPRLSPRHLLAVILRRRRRQRHLHPRHRRHPRHPTARRHPRASRRPRRHRQHHQTCPRSPRRPTSPPTDACAVRRVIPGTLSWARRQTPL